MDNFKIIYENPLFGILLTIVAYEIAVAIYNKSKQFVFLNPLPVSIIIVVAALLLCDIPYDTYNIGGNIITMLISPITVVLAVPLFKQINMLRENWVVILIAITLGCVTAISGLCVFQMFFPMDTAVFASVLPKSITTAIAVELTQQFGGVPAITVVAVLIAGVFGAVFTPIMSKLFRIKNEIALGLAIGTSSHALGTTKAFEMGEGIGAMSSLSISVAGIITVLVAPIIVRLFGLI